MKTLIGGVEIDWEEHGRGQPLLLVHAFPLDRRMWAEVVPPLAQRARVVTLDVRGLGGSGGTGGIDDFADDAAALLDALEIERAVVGGVSMGGYVALAFAARHAHRLAGLLLADTRAGADSPEGRAGRDQAIARIGREGTGGWLGGFLPRLVARTEGRAWETVRAIAAAQPAAGVAAALAAMRDRPDRTALLPTLRVPALVVVGGADGLIPPAEARALAAAIPGAELAELPGVGHLPPLEAPAAFARAVEGLLARTERATAS